MVAAKLTGYLLREIVVRGSRGGPLVPLASQLNGDVTQLQGQRIEAVLGQLAGEVRQALARLDTTHAVAAAPVALAQLPAMTAGDAGRDDELAVLARLLDPAWTGMVVSVAGLAGIGKTTLAIQAGMQPSGGSGSAAGCCLSTCTAITRRQWRRGRRLMRCCGRWQCPQCTSRPQLRSVPGYTTQSWPRPPIRCC